MHPIFNNGLTSLVNLGKTFSNVKISFAQCISAIRNIREVSSKSRNSREVSSKSRNSREVSSKSVTEQHLQLIKYANSQEYLHRTKSQDVTIIKCYGTPSRKKNRAPDPILLDLVKRANTPTSLQKTKAEGVTIGTVSEK